MASRPLDSRKTDETTSRRGKVGLELGLLRSAELPRVAMEALAQGLDSPALRRLAGELKPTASECEPQFRQALSQLSIPLPTREAARLIVARYNAMQIVNGLISPYRGA